MATSKRIPKNFVHRLGRHHFAHLRAVAESVDPIDSARLYLAIEHGHECVTAHRQAHTPSSGRYPHPHEGVLIPASLLGLGSH